MTIIPFDKYRKRRDERLRRERGEKPMVPADLRERIAKLRGKEDPEET